MRTGGTIRRKRTFVIWLLLSILVCTIPNDTLSAKVVLANETSYDIKQVILELLQWKKEELGVMAEEPLLSNTYLQNAGSSNGDWYPIALGRLGYADDYDAYLAVIGQNVRTRYQKKDKLDRVKATEWHRIALAVLAMGGNPTDMGKDDTGKTIDLIADGTYNRGYHMDIGAQGLNGYIWGLITLDSKAYEVPNDAYYDREDFIYELLCRQLEDGGFCLDENSHMMDVDITAMVLQALAPYYKEQKNYQYQNKKGETIHTTVKEVIDKALYALSLVQQEDGDFASWGTVNVESTAQVLIALCSLGIDYAKDARFIKNGATIFDGLMKYRRDDGGFTHSFVYDEENESAKPYESNSMAGEQVLCALTALYRYRSGYHRLYDFSSETDSGEILNVLEAKEQSEDVTITETDIKDYQQLLGEVTTKDYVTVVRLLGKLENQSDNVSYAFMQVELKERLEQIEVLKKTIETINHEIMDTLYPFETIGLKDQKTIERLENKIEELNEYDKLQIQGYEDILRVKTQIRTKIRAIQIGIVVLGSTLILIVIVGYRVKKRRREKRKEKVGYYPSEDSNDEDEE